MNKIKKEATLTIRCSRDFLDNLEKLVPLYSDDIGIPLSRADTLAILVKKALIQLEREHNQK